MGKSQQSIASAPVGARSPPDRWSTLRRVAPLILSLALACGDHDDHGVGPGHATTHFVSPAGLSGNDGSAAHPWDLVTALAGAGGAVQAGDTVWLRGGTYVGDFRTSLSGAPGRPIVFRQFPGEHAVLDGGLRLQSGSDVTFWGFEIMQSNPLATANLPTLETHAPRSRFINLVIHDAGQQGITFWDEAVDAEIYGCIVYNNGTHPNRDHGVYVHNTAGTKLIQDNVFFDNLAYGIHVFGDSADPVQRNVHVQGNVVFNNGTISSTYPAKGNILIGGNTPAAGMQVIDNMLYFGGREGVNLGLGFSAQNQDLIATGNYIRGGGTALKVSRWSQLALEHNTLSGPARMVDVVGVPAGVTWDNNVYFRDPADTAWHVDSVAYSLPLWSAATGLGETDVALLNAPADPRVFVRANKYEPGRALIVIFNWPRAGSVAVDVSGVLVSGSRYEVHNVQNPLGPAVAGGTWTAGTISIPMTGLDPPAPLGRTTPLPSRTAPDFDAFVLTSTPPQ